MSDYTRVEEGRVAKVVEVTPNANPTHAYFETHEKLHGFLSKQYPTIANPAPLGLCGFALTTFVLSMMNAGGTVNQTASVGVVCGLAMYYGGLCQLLAGMWEFKTGNTYGACAFSSYGGFWMSFAALFNKDYGFLAGYTNSTDLDHALGLYLFAWGFYSFFMMVASHRTTIVLFVLFGFVTLTFLMLSIHNYVGGNLHCQRAGGCFGIIAAAIAWYAAMAALLTKKNSLFTLPVGELDPIYKKWGWVKEE